MSMYATIVWNISPSSVNSQKIKEDLGRILGERLSTFLWANAALMDIDNTDTLASVGRELETLHLRFPAEFDYLCVGSAAGTRLAPLSRQAWDLPTIQRIIS